MTDITNPMREMIAFDAPYFSFQDEPTFPTVPFSPTVNVSELTAGDPNPQFVTRPLAVIGGVSKNGLKYDEALLTAIEQQAVGKVARQGHVSEANRSWEFPDDVGIWVGVKREGNTLYGKCFIYPGTHFAEMVKNRRAAGGSLSNSIWGNAALAENPDGTLRSVGLELESIDFVPAERAALGALGGEFEVTAEMSGVYSMAEEADNDMDEMEAARAAISKLQSDTLSEMLSDAQKEHLFSSQLSQCDGAKLYEMMTPAHRTTVCESYLKEKGMKMVSEAAENKNVSEMAATNSEVAALKTRLAEMEAADSKRNTEAAQQATAFAEMQTTIKRYQREEFDRALAAEVAAYFSDWRVHTTDGETKLNALKNNLRVLTVAEMAGSTEQADIKAAAEKAWPNVKPLAELTLASLAGPSAIVGVTTSGGGGTDRFGWDKQTGRYTDDAVQNAVSRTNVLNGRENNRAGGVK